MDETPEGYEALIRYEDGSKRYIRTYKGKHRKSGIWARFRRNRPNVFESIENLPKPVIWHETDKFVGFMPRWTKEYELPDYCAN